MASSAAGGCLADAVPRGRRGRPAVRLGHGGPRGRTRSRWPRTGRRSRVPAPEAGRAEARARRPTTRRSSRRSWSPWAAEDRRIVGITAGMPTGTGLAKFQARLPGAVHRRRDRRAARGHAGHRPRARRACARSSRSTRRSSSGPSTRRSTTSARTTRPVVLAVDRAGLVGEDGTSHQGMFTIPAQRMLPNLVIASPQGRAGAPRRCCGRRSPRTTRSRCTTRAMPGSACPEREPEVAPGRPRRGAPRGPRPAVRRLRADHDAGARGRGRARGARLVGRA